MRWVIYALHEVRDWIGNSATTDQAGRKLVVCLLALWIAILLGWHLIAWVVSTLS